MIKEIYKTQKIKITYPAAAEAIGRVLMDNDICEMAIAEAARKILAAIGISNKQDWYS